MGTTDKGGSGSAENGWRGGQPLVAHHICLPHMLWMRYMPRRVLWMAAFCSAMELHPLEVQTTTICCLLRRHSTCIPGVRWLPSYHGRRAQTSNPQILPLRPMVRCSPGHWHTEGSLEPWPRVELGTQPQSCACWARNMTTSRPLEVRRLKTIECMLSDLQPNMMSTGTHTYTYTLPRYTFSQNSLTMS